MGWAESIGMAINYIEEHICEELTPEMIVRKPRFLRSIFKRVLLCFAE